MFLMNILLPRMRKKKHTYTSLSNDYATMNHFSYNNTYKILLALFKCNFTALSELKLINPSNKKTKGKTTTFINLCECTVRDA